MKTEIRVKDLRSVLGQASDGTLYAHIARLAVLYEDLRIEAFACAQDSIPVLDVTDDKYRRHYFLRRSIATLTEFAEAIRLLDECPEMSRIKHSFSAAARQAWKESAEFFSKNEELMKKVRNDLGGHFGVNAAKYAVDNLGTNVGRIAQTEQDIWLPFAGDIAAIASLRHLPGQTDEEKFRGFIEQVVAAFRHAVQAVHCLVVFHLWERFG